MDQLLEIFQQMLNENTSPAEMIRILYHDFYRDIMFSSFDNASQRDTDIRYLEDFSVNYETLDSFLNELSLVGSNNGVGAFLLFIKCSIPV